ncbi:hypothetical protein PMAYCL1PPCAC_31095, partial [Pristionchus mayeri]
DVGGVDGLHFTACAVGFELVVLANNERVELISTPTTKNGASPTTKNGASPSITRVVCSHDSGRVAVSFGSLIRTFAPTRSRLSTGRIIDYDWRETQSIISCAPIDCMQWASGRRLMISCENFLFLCHHAIFTEGSRVTYPLFAEDHSLRVNQWNRVWKCIVREPIHHIDCSPDGVYFATRRRNDETVRVWYTETR